LCDKQTIPPRRDLFVLVLSLFYKRPTWPKKVRLMTGTRASKNAKLISSFCLASRAVFMQCGQSGVPSAGAGESVPVPVSVGDSSTIGVSIGYFVFQPEADPPLAEIIYFLF
jgi:hypothetical protein